MVLVETRTGSGSYDLSQSPVRRNQDLRRIEKFASQEPFRDLPQALLEIAISTSHYALKIPRRELVKHAVVVDSLLQTDTFGQSEQERSGTILQRVATFTGISGLTEISQWKLNIDTINLLRFSIGLSLVRLELAKEIGYTKGQEDDLFTNKDFLSAQALCSLALREILRSRKRNMDGASQSMKAKWGEEEYRGKVIKSRNREEYTREQSLRSRKFWKELREDKESLESLKGKFSVAARRRIERNGVGSMALFRGKKHTPEFIAYKSGLRDKRGRFISLEQPTQSV